jgi:serine/threonine protein kinase
MEYFSLCSSSGGWDDDDSLDLRPKQALGQRFSLVQKLGKGGFGQVWRAKDRWLDQEVALKVSRQDLKKETLLLRRLPKDRFINVFDYIKDDGLDATAYSMEVLEKPWMTLTNYHAEYLQAKKNDKATRFRNLQISLCICIDVLNTLQILHGNKYAKTGRWCHSDIKPDNIYIHANSMAKLASQHEWGDDFASVTKIGDLGLAHQSGDNPYAGTNGFMGPEVTNRKAVSAANDIFAVGQTLAVLLLGDVFSKENLINVVRMRTRLSQQIPSQYLVTRLSDILRQMTAGTPQTRPSAKDSVKLIQGVISSRYDWAILKAFSNGTTPTLRIDEATRSLFDVIRYDRDKCWNNLTIERSAYLKKKIREATSRGLLSINGHNYSIQ